jgi:hypothetical protein
VQQLLHGGLGGGLEHQAWAHEHAAEAPAPGLQGAQHHRRGVLAADAPQKGQDLLDLDAGVLAEPDGVGGDAIGGRALVLRLPFGKALQLIALVERLGHGQPHAKVVVDGSQRHLGGSPGGGRRRWGGAAGLGRAILGFSRA